MKLMCPKENTPELPTNTLRPTTRTSVMSAFTTARSIVVPPSEPKSMATMTSAHRPTRSPDRRAARPRNPTSDPRLEGADLEEAARSQGHEGEDAEEQEGVAVAAELERQRLLEDHAGGPQQVPADHGTGEAP